MSYCPVCGHKLITRELKSEGFIPYCTACKEFRFPTFNTAISAIVYHPDADKILLIKQYGKNRNILVAGYVNKGENAEHALARELKEEMGLCAVSCCFNKSEYFEKSNTLMLNYACIADSGDLSKMTAEVDSAAWYSPTEARNAISPGSLAEKFLLCWLNRRACYDHAFDTYCFR